jgi:hypothetical protein
LPATAKATPPCSGNLANRQKFGLGCPIRFFLGLVIELLKTDFCNSNRQKLSPLQSGILYLATGRNKIHKCAHRNFCPFGNFLLHQNRVYLNADYAASASAAPYPTMTNPACYSNRVLKKGTLAEKSLKMTDGFVIPYRQGPRTSCRSGSRNTASRESFIADRRLPALNASNSDLRVAPALISSQACTCDRPGCRDKTNH